MNNEKLFKAQVSVASAYIRAHGQYVQHPKEVAEYAAMVVKLLSENDIESVVLEDEDYED